MSKISSLSFNYLGTSIFIYDVESKEVDTIRIITRNHAVLGRTSKQLVTALLERFPYLTIESSSR